MNKPALLLLSLALGAFGQRFDTSNTGALHGDYFVREILITGQSLSGDIVSASGAIGVATFNGSGSYKFAGARGKNRPAATVWARTACSTSRASWTVRNIRMADSPVSGRRLLWQVRPKARAGIFWWPSRPETRSTAASLNGNYTAGYVSFRTPT